MLTADPSWKPGVLSPKQTALVRHHLKEVTASHAFAGSKRSQVFLQLIVEHALEGEVDSLRERMIGAEMFGRPVDYDTGSDSVVRVKATEVRKRLAQCYLETDEKLAVRIELPSGSYVPRFIFEPLEKKAQPQTAVVPLTSVVQTGAQGEVRSGDRSAPRIEQTPRLPAQKSRLPLRVLPGAAVGLTLLAVIG